jgi:hypothetical protein
MITTSPTIEGDNSKGLANIEMSNRALAGIKTRLGGTRKDEEIF